MTSLVLDCLQTSTERLNHLLFLPVQLAKTEELVADAWLCRS